MINREIFACHGLCESCHTLFVGVHMLCVCLAVLVLSKERMLDRLNDFGCISIRNFFNMIVIVYSDN
jgi:hypothetical protein